MVHRGLDFELAKLESSFGRHKSIQVRNRVAKGSYSFDSKTSV
jgi:hypothetical protein